MVRIGIGILGPKFTPPTSRLWFLFRLLKLGLKLSDEKLGAFLRGDQSGTVLHRFFVCGPLTLATPFILDNTPAAIRFQARQIQVALEYLADLFSGKNYKTKVQCAAYAAGGYTLMRMPLTALRYIRKSCDFIEAGGLRFIPTCGRAAEFSEDLHETLVALSQTVYMANYLFLMCGGPEPHATAGLEREFRQELPVGGLTPIPLDIQLIFHNSKPIRSSSRSVL